MSEDGIVYRSRLTVAWCRVVWYNSVDFLRVSGISGAASVRRALSRLAELRYIYKYRDEWKFNSTFFRSWLKRYAELDTTTNTR